jgi:hypothetical protein
MLLQATKQNSGILQDSRETTGQVDRYGDQRCQKTVRGLRMAKINSRPEYMGKKH